MISRRISDFKKLSAYYIHDNPHHPSVEHQQLVKVVSFVYPSCVFKGYVADVNSVKNGEVLVSTKPDFLALHGENRILHVLNSDYYWGPQACILRIIENKIQDQYGKFNRDDWARYIECHGRKRVSSPAEQRKFLSKHWRIRRAGTSGLLRFIPTLERTPYHLPREGKLGLGYISDIVRSFEKKDRESIARVKQRLSDDRSRDRYQDLTYADPVKLWENYYYHCTELPQYMDYIVLNDQSVVFNIGVDAGFEIPSFLSYNVSKLYNIDPTGEVFLERYVKEWSDYFKKKIEFVRCAVTDRDGEIELGIKDESLLGSKSYTPMELAVLFQSRDLVKKTFPGMTLSTLASKFSLSRVDLVKVDIDGGEEGLLGGLPAFVKKYRPQLAFSIYHNVKDFFEMANKLMDMCPDYKFYCKTYSYERYETILYCIPAGIDKNRAGSIGA